MPLVPEQGPRKPRACSGSRAAPLSAVDLSESERDHLSERTMDQGGTAGLILAPEAVRLWGRFVISEEIGMEAIRISDITMKRLAGSGSALTFKGKLEIVKLLDRLNVSVIELEGLNGSRADSLRVKSAASAVRGSILAVPVGLDPGGAAAVWDALKDARKPRLQVAAPASTVQMEYLSHKKPDAMLRAVASAVAECARCAGDVEFIAEDATRSEGEFLRALIGAAIEAGATTVTVCDAAGTMLPDEFSEFIAGLFRDIPALAGITLGVECSNALAMADACSVAAVRAGAREIKTSAVDTGTALLQSTAGILAARSELFNAETSLHSVELRRVVGQIDRLCRAPRNKTSPFEDGVQDESEDEPVLSLSDGEDEVLKAARRIGYDLNSEDARAVWEAAREILRHKESMGKRELDAVIASTALQVPSTYTVESYVINSGNHISAMAHIKLNHHGTSSEGIALGDGPIDAAFLAIEQITHHHYELDDFQIRAVTEGREAMGETVVRLVSNGKLYSGRGISTDIVGSSIQAYMNALNKISYEEAEE